MLASRIPLAFPLACLAALALVFISEGSYRQAVGTLDALGAMAVARSNIQSVERSMLNAETGQRGYLLSGDPEYRRPYDEALRDIDGTLRFLRQHYRDDARARDVVARLDELIETKLSEIALTIRLFDEGKRRTTEEILMSGIGRERMDAIRAFGAELLALESRRVAAGRDDIYRTLMWSRVGVALLATGCLVALLLYLRQSTALVRQQLEQKRRALSERDRLELEVAQRTAQLTELARHLQTAREDERSRLARDLHDELGALLTSAKLDAARIRPRLAGLAPEVQERLTHLVDTLNSGIALKRRIIEDLRPSALGNLGLGAALEILAREFAEQTGIRVHDQLDAVSLDADSELVIYRLVQEAITNIGKHARARQVWIRLVAHGERVEVSVRDDGVGFDPAVRQASSHGLIGMRFRVEAHGGTLHLHSAPGQGTSIAVTLPVLQRDAMSADHEAA